MEVLKAYLRFLKSFANLGDAINIHLPRNISIYQQKVFIYEFQISPPKSCLVRHKLTIIIVNHLNNGPPPLTSGVLLLVSP
jgi:hypothetical protein